MNSLSTIRFKIIAVLAACGAITLAIGVFGIFGLSRVNDNVANVYSEVILPLSNISDVRADVLMVRLDLRRVQATHTPDAVAQLAPAIKTALAHIDKTWHTYYPASVSNPDERRIADAADGGLTQFAKDTNDQIALFEAGNFDKGSEAVDKSSQSVDVVIKSLQDDEAINVQEAKQYVADSESMYGTLRLIAIGLVVLGGAILAGAAMFLMRAITQPLNKALEVANEIADGRLDNQIEITSRDEFAVLLGALQKMDRQLSDTVRGIKRSTESVTHASREIAAGNLDLSSRTEEQAASLEETASSMTELTETVRQNAENARQANSMAANATDMATTGNEAVRAMVDTIGKISDSSSKISDITGLIEGIAFQTNILALNAAVEAARAGEQGRGFAVVASEVRSLAQRSASAAKEIKDLIGTSVTMIHDGSQQAGEVGATMDQVKQAIQRVADIVGEISSASDEQSKGIEQVNQAINQMDNVTQQNAALVEQAAAAAQSLEEQANNLKTAVSVFRVKDGGDAPRTAMPTMAKPVAAKPVVSKPAPAARKTPARSEAPRRPAAAPRAAAVDRAPALAVEGGGDDNWQTF
ncbi:Methyl-accepting chemotaxis serine transducer [Pararobbsia alpina]|uniref:methyl-accepting chemotaxis protein n=1 Tax=Pararobbsia alpina TaxID=621374 RepID=UPI0039A55696